MPKLGGDVLLHCVRYLLRPLARFCLKHSVKIQDLLECMKVELISAAQEELTSKGIKDTQSRLSILTGLRRREVERLLSGQTKLSAPQSLVAKVVGLWQEDPRFCTTTGTPRVLSISGDASEFTQLVRSVSNDLNPATVLFELRRVGAVEERKRGVCLIAHNYIPKGDALAGFQILTRDSEDLLNAVQDNVLKTQSPPHHHLRTEYDSVRAEAVPHLKKWFLREGHALHLRLREEIAKHDQEVNPQHEYQGKKVNVSFTSFSFIDDEESEEPTHE